MDRLRENLEAFKMKNTLETLDNYFDFLSSPQLIEPLKKVHFENRLPDKLKVLAKYRLLIIDEIGYFPMKRGFADVTSASTILDRVPASLHRH